MIPTEVNRFNMLYQRHLRLLKLQGKSQKTIDAYSRAVRRIRDHFKEKGTVQRKGDGSVLCFNFLFRPSNGSQRIRDCML